MEEEYGVLVPETRDEFEDWIYQYPYGYVINDKGSAGVMIHFGKCGHFKHGNKSASLTKNTKYCSRNRKTLESYWEATRRRNPATCRSCKT
jgi:hypothetical protein